MNYIDLIRNIEKGQLNNIILIHDKESYLTEIAIDSLKADLLNPSFVDLNFVKFQFEKMDKASYLSAVQTLPFMDQRRLIVIDDIHLEKDKIKKYQDKFDFIQQDLKDFNESSILIMIYRGKAIYKTGKFYKNIDKLGQVYVVDRLDKKQFQGFIIKHFAKSAIRLDSLTANFIIERLGYLQRDSKLSLYDVVNELDKLSNHLKDKNLKLEDIEQAVLEYFQDNIFMLTDALSNREVKKALMLYMRMKDEDEFMIFHMILRQVKNLICVKDCDQKRLNKATGMKYCMIGAFEYDKNIRFSKNFSLDELVKIHELCFYTEEKIKTSGLAMKDQIRRIILAFAR
ncbi:MAG: DNA polymerase III subunit delta [Tissierellia bacterium]|nr:DNA polymerase III subunit delta [Tissierellia bacterium]